MHTSNMLAITYLDKVWLTYLFKVLILDLYIICDIVLCFKKSRTYLHINSCESMSKLFLLLTKTV